MYYVYSMSIFEGQGVTVNVYLQGVHISGA